MALTKGAKIFLWIFVIIAVCAILGFISWAIYYMSTPTKTTDSQGNQVEQITYTRYPNQNTVYGAVSSAGSSNEHVKYLGKFNDYESCEHECANDPDCKAYAWHDSSKGSYAYQCYARDGTYTLTAQSGVYSGVRN
jgi:hypothetical protein